MRFQDNVTQNNLPVSWITRVLSESAISKPPAKAGSRRMVPTVPGIKSTREYYRAVHHRGVWIRAEPTKLKYTKVLFKGPTDTIVEVVGKRMVNDGEFDRIWLNTAVPVKGWVTSKTLEDPPGANVVLHKIANPNIPDYSDEGKPEKVEQNTVERILARHGLSFTKESIQKHLGGQRYTTMMMIDVDGSGLAQKYEQKYGGKNPKAGSETLRLHGTPLTNAVNIAATGMAMTHAGANGQTYGSGVYTTAKMGTAIAYAKHKNSDRWGNLAILICAVNVDTASYKTEYAYVNPDPKDVLPLVAVIFGKGDIE